MSLGTGIRWGDPHRSLGPPLPFLPPEVKLVILNHLPFEDVKKSATLVDKAWGSVAKTSLGERGILNLDERTLKEILQLEENTKVYCKTIRIEHDENGGSLPEFTAMMINILKNKVDGGGGMIEHLIIEDYSSNNREETAEFFEQLFSACPNVKQFSLRRDISDWGTSHVTSLYPVTAVLKYCVCIEWLCNGSNPPSPCFWFFMAIMAMPNVTRIITPTENLKFLALQWMDSTSKSHFVSRGHSWLTFVVRQFTTSEILKVMDTFSGTLEVFELQSSFGSKNKVIRECVPNDPAPVMPNLHTLSFVDASPEDFSKVGFIFGDLLNPTFVQRPMRLDTHFPTLKSLRFTVRDYNATEELTQSCIFLLNFFPILLDSNDLTSYPNIEYLQLNWPDPEKDWDLWKDWTRRVDCKFPNLQGNPHVDEWKELKCMDNEQREDQVDIEWRNYQQLYEARRRNTPPQLMKPWW